MPDYGPGLMAPVQVVVQLMANILVDRAQGLCEYLAWDFFFFILNTAFGDIPESTKKHLYTM